MADYRCPDCGAPVSTAAVVCPTCGFPIRPQMLQRGGRFGGGGGSNTTLIVAAVVAGGLFALVMIGVLAAIAIPRFVQVSQRAREREGEALLRWAYTAEQTHHAQNGAYTASVETLAQLLPPPAPATPKRYTLEVSAASDRDLCLEAVPVAGTDGRALSMDALASLFRRAGCSGEPDFTTPLGSDIAPPSGSGGDEGARQIMREVHESIVAYRAAHGGENPHELSDVVTRVHDSPAMSEYEVSLAHGDARGVCAALLPRNPLAGLHAYSVDQDGNLHQSASCMGNAVEHFTSPAADAGSASGSGDPSSAAYEEPGKREDKPLLPIERAP